MKRFLKRQLKEWPENFWTRWFVFLVIAGIASLFIYFYNLPDFLYSFPIALVSVIGYGIFEALDWHKFLVNSILGVIQDGKYLKSLNRAKLDEMLDTLHTIYFELPEKMESDNLYQFVRENILNRYIGKAYIENREITWEFEFLARCGTSEDSAGHKITMTDEYILKTPAQKETKTTIEVQLIVIPIKQLDVLEHFPLDEWEIKTAPVSSSNWESFPVSRVHIREAKEHKHELSYPLAITVSRDCPIKVRIKRVGYEHPSERIAHLLCPLPTHRFKLTIIVHNLENVIFDHRFNGIPPSQPDRAETVTEGRRFELEYGGWFIPGNTVTVDF